MRKTSGVSPTGFVRDATSRGPLWGALDALYVAIQRTKVNWILDLDWRGFFDNISHEKLIEVMGYRIADPRILRLIQKWLKAGVVKDGVGSETEAGTPQGAVVSPLLSNVYLHYVLDQWSDRWRQTERGAMTIVRYADDAIYGFQHEDRARQYLKDLRERLRQFGLELNEEKTKLIRFGRYARLNRAERGEGKPETFTFLGFKHICANAIGGWFEVRRNTDSQRWRKKLLEIKQELRRKMHEPIAKVGEWLRSVLLGYYQYHAVSGNLSVLSGFRFQVARRWFRVLSQRSQRRPTWEQLGPIIDFWLPIPTLVHPYPEARFDARHPLRMPHIQGKNRMQ